MNPGVFLLGGTAFLAPALRAAGLEVLGHVASLDLFFPLARHARAAAVLYGRPQPGPEPDLAAEVAQLRVLLPETFLAVLAHEAGGELTEAGANLVFLPPHDPARLAAALAAALGRRPRPEAAPAARRPADLSPDEERRAPPAPSPDRDHGGDGGWPPADASPGAAEAGGWPPAWPPAERGAWGGAAGWRPHPLPPDPDGHALALRRRRAWRQHLDPRPPRTVAVVGARGGVGRTFLAVNLAAAAALATGAPTLLLDLGGWGDALAHLDVAGGPCLLDLLPHLGEEGSPPAPAGLPAPAREPLTGLHVLPGVPRPELDDLVTPGHVQALLAWAAAAYALTVIIAPGRGRDDRLARCCQGVERILLVSTPETPALRQAGLLLEWLEKRGLPWREHLLLVLSRVGREGAAAAARCDQVTGLRPVALVPEDRRAVEAAIMSGRPLAAAHPDHPLARAVWHLLGRLLPGLTPPPTPPWGRLLSLLGRNGR